jgi:subtilisin family serine protease
MAQQSLGGDSLKFLANVIALGFLAVSALGAGAAAHPHFVAVKGDHEFTGQMIARPKQLAQLESEGLNTYEAVLRKGFTASLVAGGAVQYRPQLDDYVINVPKGYDEDRFAAELLAKGDFQYVEPNWRVFIDSSPPNDPLYPQQWHLPKIHADAAYDLFVGNNSVIVALTDTGIRQDHEDLVGALVPGYNAQTNTTQAAGGDVNDTNGHGTHTAGIAGAVGNNGIGVSGVCQQVRVMPIKVVIGGGGSSSIAILTGGALWAADHGARVVSTSFSGFDSSNTVQTTGDYIKHTRNGLYCWAAGNDNRNLTGGDWPDVTICGASDSNDIRASFSAYGLAIDVFAPGVNVLSTYASASNGYTQLSGTSMATPCTAGVGAMIIMANPSLTGQQVEDILYHTCDNIGDPNVFGWGRVNLDSALRLVYNTTTFSPASLTVTMGLQTGGDVGQLGTTDNQFFTGSTFPNVSRVSSFQVVYDTYTTISNIGSLTFTYAGMASAADIMQRIELFDWTANAYVLLDQRLAAQTVLPITLVPSTPNRFKQPGTGLMRARVTDSRTMARSTVQISVDQVAFLTTP